MARTIPMEWLVETQGVHDLNDAEFNAIRDFTLLWGLFEGRAMGTYGNQNEIVLAVGRMNLPEPLPEDFDAALEFWRDRYWFQDAPSHSFNSLQFAANPHRTDTLNVLSGACEDPIGVTKALLQITMRLRNNLFHGVKWQYRLHDQFQNFKHANAVLMAAVEFSPPGT